MKELSTNFVRVSDIKIQKNAFEYCMSCALGGLNFDHVVAGYTILYVTLYIVYTACASISILYI